MLEALAETWQLEYVAPIPRGTVSVVFRCRTADGRSAVLKASPDRERLAFEAAALHGWQTAHTPAVLNLEERMGALLLEAIDPGTPLDSAPTYPPLETVAKLLTSLHAAGVPETGYATVERRVTYLFESSKKLYERHPDLAGVVSPGLYEQGRRCATRLARDDAPTVLLHGDLTPANTLDGGPGRGLVAIDPAPCLGDAAFDAVDLVFWLADDLDAIEARIHRLAALTGVEAARLHGWCVAFAGMAALETASGEAPPAGRVDALRQLASRAADT